MKNCKERYLYQHYINGKKVFKDESLKKAKGHEPEFSQVEDELCEWFLYERANSNIN